MDYCIVNSEGIIVNIIVAEADFAEEIGALPGYDGAAIRGKYSPPPPALTTEERLAAQVTYTAMMTDTLMEG